MAKHVLLNRQIVQQKRIKMELTQEKVINISFLNLFLDKNIFWPYHY